MQLKGKCNQCGNCCMLGAFKCTNLIATGHIGGPMATRCAVYDKRYPDMPITMVAPDGQTLKAFCLHNTEAEKQILIEMVLKNQCYLEVE